MSKTLTNHPRVDEVEPDNPGYFIYLKYGWTIEPECNGEGCHCFGADNVRDALAIIRGASPCTCTSCSEHQARRRVE